MAVPGSANWREQILQGIGAPVTPANLRFLDAWARAEGGSASNNPFNTTLPAPGAGSYNSVGVRNFVSPEQGIRATIDTLLNGRYANIIGALKQGSDPMSAANALASSPWGTGGLVQKILGGAPSSVPLSATPTSVPTTSAAPPPPTRALLNVAPQPDFSQAILGSIGKGPNALTNALIAASNRSELSPISTIPSPTLPQPSVSAPGGSASAPSSGARGRVTLGANADRAGVSIHPEVVNFVGKIAGLAGTPLTIGTGTNHNQYVVGTHRQSAHWTGWAADVPAAGDQLTQLGRDALVAAGMDPKQASQQKGGLFNIGPYQIIFNSDIGGNHWNHLHVGLSGDHAG